MAKQLSLDELTEDNRYFHLVQYHPYWLKDKTKNPDVDSNSKAIMDLKTPKDGDEEWKIKKHQAAIRYFAKWLQRALNHQFEGYESIQIAIVPSSKQYKISRGLKSIIESLQTEVKIIFDESFLVRVEDVSSAHEGGSRNIDKHLKTIQVQKIPDPIIPIIVFDDVTTTGNSLSACKILLSEAGCKHIVMLAIGQTAETNE